MGAVVVLLAGGMAQMLLVVHELDDLLGHAQGLLEVLLLPARLPRLVPRAAQHGDDQLQVSQAQSRRPGALDQLQDQMLHAGLVQEPHDHDQLLRAQAQAGVAVAFQGAHDILPVLGRLARLEDVAEVHAIGGHVLVAVEVLERQRDVAERDVDGLLLELGAVLGPVHEALLLRREVERQQDPRVERGQQLCQLGRRRCEERGQRAAVEGRSAREGAVRAAGEGGELRAVEERRAAAVPY